MRLAFILCLVATAALAHPGIGLVEDSKGNVFYTDLARVWKISPDGKKSVAVPGVHTHELFLDEDDNLYGEHLWYNGEQKDTWGHYAWKLTKGGKFQKVIPDSEGFLTDYSFVRDHFGRMYWADRSDKCQHVVRKNKDNSKTTVSEGCLENVRWMTSSKEGLIYLIDQHDLKRVDARGKVTTLVKSEAHYMGGVTVDRQDNIYMADFTARTVSRIDNKGINTIIYTGAFPWGPTALVVAKNGDYLVLETSNINDVRLKRVSSDKKTTVY